MTTENPLGRGTPVWGINRFRSDALGHLLDDLVEQERLGIKEEVCDQVKRALDRVVNAASAIPDGSYWKGTIYQEIDGFAKVYHRWNSHANVPDKAPLRRKSLGELRKLRHQIAKRIRSNQHVLATELDTDVARQMFDALGELCGRAEGVFPNLARAVDRYRVRAAGDDPGLQLPGERGSPHRDPPRGGPSGRDGSGTDDATRDPPLITSRKQSNRSADLDPV